MLSDRDIRWRMSPDRLSWEFLDLWPLPEDNAIQPASIDLRLGAVASKKNFRDQWMLEPGDFVLATTLEYVEIPADLAARVEGKSSWGRQGLAVHITAGFIDPGFRGQITLELKNMGNGYILLDEDDYICQLSFFQLTSPALRPYGSEGLGSHYQNQSGITQSRMEK